MATRRKFLRQSLMGGAAVFARVSGPAAGGPIVVSTWDFGKSANAGAWEVLGKGGRALDAVEQGVRIPEADPSIQTIGYGGLPDRDGRVTLDACIMDDRYNCGSVMCLEYIKHPISVARLVMEKTPHIILAGDGALQFALANGFHKENLLTDKSKKDYEEWLKTSHYSPEVNIENRLHDPMPGGATNHDTIGMLAMDEQGNLSGACTTSGLAYKMHGRVGDSPVIGAGLYVDNEVGAATATGVGEEVIRIVGSHLIVELMRQGLSPEAACREGIGRIIRRGPDRAKDIQVGFLALNKKGEYGAYCLQQGFTYAVRSEKEDRIYKGKSIY
ncbi:MAG: N(4)-(beta-N-acetylglucosaminyl)-L-asparaginase [Bacteroidetes bacterium]|nr:N(4)-(beta-N-acetylglucosaminyl)-L-asparaginase [Bacteroidota bacterium]